MLKSLSWAFQVALVIKNLPANAGDPGLERSPEGGHGNPLQYSCLENPMDRGAWQAIRSIESQRVRHDWRDLAHTKISLIEKFRKIWWKIVILMYYRSDQQILLYWVQAYAWYYLTDSKYRKNDRSYQQNRVDNYQFSNSSEITDLENMIISGY